MRQRYEIINLYANDYEVFFIIYEEKERKQQKKLGIYQVLQEMIMCREGFVGLS